MISIAILGFGVVGSGTAEVLSENRKLITEYRRRWSAMLDVKDNGFFATTPFFISFVDDPATLRHAKAQYLLGLLDLYAGDTTAASEKMKDSFSHNNDNLFALLYR